MAQKVRVKVKKKKVNFKKVFIGIIVLILLLMGCYYYLTMPIKQIYVSGNDNLTEDTILDIAKVNDNSSFAFTLSYNIKKHLKDNDYIKNVKVHKTISRKLYIEIKENKIICLYNNKLILENGKTVVNKYNISDIPILINDVGDLNDRFVSKFSKINNDIELKISQIEYVPTSVDKDRFLLYMTDGNYVYITLSKINKLNKYGEIFEEMNGKNGIVYLDSGDYVDIK